MKINVSVDNNKYKYSAGGHDPMHEKFTHHFVVGDKITWQSNQRVPFFRARLQYSIRTSQETCITSPSNTRFRCPIRPTHTRTTPK